MLSRALEETAACWLEGTPVGADMLPGMKVAKFMNDGNNIGLRQPWTRQHGQRTRTYGYGALSTVGEGARAGGVTGR